MTDLRKAAENALEALKNNRRNHYYCEDTWYSCPKHEDGCANESAGNDCDCGADETNQIIDFAIASLRQTLAQTEAQVCCGDYEKCWKACTPRGRWLAEKEITKPKQLKYSDIVSDGGIDPRNKFDAQSKQKPVAWCSLNGRGEIGYFDGNPMIMVGEIGNEHHETPLYTSPITHEWMDLHKDEIKQILNDSEEWSSLDFAQAVSDLLREKNT